MIWKAVRIGIWFIRARSLLKRSTRVDECAAAALLFHFIKTIFYEYLQMCKQDPMLSQILVNLNLYFQTSTLTLKTLCYI